MNIKKAHEEIETIYYKSVDHMHADMLHRFIDEQQETIDMTRDELALHFTKEIEHLVPSEELGAYNEAFKTKFQAMTDEDFETYHRMYTFSMDSGCGIDVVPHETDSPTADCKIELCKCEICTSDLTCGMCDSWDYINESEGGLCEMMGDMLDRPYAVLPDHPACHEYKDRERDDV